MASNITLSAGVRQNLLALQNTAALLSTTQNRLATGKKVNSALDNPTNFFTSSALASRASDLSKLLDSMANGINTVKAADNGLTAITTAVESLKATVTQARQDASYKSSSFSVGLTSVAATDVTASNQLVDVAQDTFTADVSATNAAVTGTRNLTLRGADGGFVTLANALTINPAPSITSISPATRGQGYADTVDITGSNLSTTSVFDFGTGIHATAPQAIAGGVQVTLAIDPDAALGARSVTVTNADHGTSTKSNAFTVTQKPVVTSVIGCSTCSRVLTSRKLNALPDGS